MTTSKPDFPVFPGDLNIYYLSGPMTGYPEFNYPAFNKAAKRMREIGLIVYSPAERRGANGEVLDTTGMSAIERLPKEAFDLREAFADYSRFITTEADAVAVLPGWEHSKGAVAEVMLGRSIGLPIVDAETGEVFDPGDRVSVLAAEAGGNKESTSAAVADGPRALHSYSSTDEVRVTSTTGGQKGTKEAAYDLIPPGPLKELAVLYGRGNIKYPPSPGEPANWKRGYPWSLSYAALRRHLDLFWMGEDYDEEMGVKHLINVAWHAFNLAWFMENKPDFDDRPRSIGDDPVEQYEGALPTPQWLRDLAAERARAKN